MKRLKRFTSILKHCIFKNHLGFKNKKTCDSVCLAAVQILLSHNIVVIQQDGSSLNNAISKHYHPQWLS